MIQDVQHILRTVIRNLKERERENESRSASHLPRSQGYTNQVYALRQKMFGSYLHDKPNSKNLETVNPGLRQLSIHVHIRYVPNVQGTNKVYELRKVMFGVLFSNLSKKVS